MPTRRVIGKIGMKPGFWRLKTTRGIETPRIDPHGVLKECDQSNQFGYLFHLDPPF
jgi:hypothetical protein